MTNPDKSTTTTATTKELCLNDYSTFQYMLAQPSVASPIVNEIQSFVFYNEPYDPHKKDPVVMVQGAISLVSYYGCCLAVLPSHLLGMSEWISSENFESSSSLVNQKDKDRSSPKILRRFQYSYYFGLLRVDTRHMQLHEEDAKDETTSSFRLVEYMDISPWAWVIAEAVFMAIFAAIIWSFQMLIALFHNSSIGNDQSPSFAWNTFVTVVVASNASWLLFRGNYRP